MAKRLLVWGLIAFAIAFRLNFSLRYFHIDIWSNAGWGQWIAENGTKDFFYNNVWVYSWPTQLPLVNLIYSWCHTIAYYLMVAVIRFGNLLEMIGGGGTLVESYRNNFVEFMAMPLNPEIPFKNSFIFSIKLIAIVSDLIIAGVIWMIAKQETRSEKLETRIKINNNTDKTWVLPVVYLISPFSWYISAFWGQYDQISFLFLLLSILTIKKWRFLSPIMFSISLGIKPTSAMFIPFYLYLLWEERKYWKHYVIGAVVGLGLNLYWVNLFNNEDSLFKFIRGRLWRMIIEKSEPRVTVNSYNFWHLWLGEKAANPNQWFLFMPYKIWGAIGVVLVNFFGWWIYRRGKKSLGTPNHLPFRERDNKNIWLALMIIGVGTWMVGTNMLERYLFGGIAFGLMALNYHKWLWKYWIAMSLMFWINLYKNWWQPGILGILRTFHEQNTWLSGVTFSLINIVIFVVLIKVTYEKIRKN